MNTTTTKTEIVAAAFDPSAPAMTQRPRHSGFVPVAHYDRVRIPDLIDFPVDEAVWALEEGTVTVTVPLPMLATFRRYMSVRGLMIPPKGLYKIEGAPNTFESLLRIVNLTCEPS